MLLGKENLGHQRKELPFRTECLLNLLSHWKNEKFEVITKKSQDVPMKHKVVLSNPTFVNKLAIFHVRKNQVLFKNL